MRIVLQVRVTFLVIFHSRGTSVSDRGQLIAALHALESDKKSQMAKINN